MTDKNPVKYYLLEILAGLALFILGLILLLKFNSAAARAAMMIGATLTLTGLLSLLIRRVAFTPQEKAAMRWQAAIEENDERNIRLKEKSAYITLQIMRIALCIFVIIVGFILPFYWPLVIMAVLLLTLASLLPVIFAAIYARRM